MAVNYETSGTLTTIITISLFALLYAGTIQYRYMKRKLAARPSKTRVFRFPADYPMSCSRQRLRKSIIDGLPARYMGVDLDTRSTEPYISRRDALLSDMTDPSLQLGYTTRDLTEEEYEEGLRLCRR
ncbi:hypothetical protein GMRT_10274 [Giardia muris]|uniref:Uncharacterized protein n=1 Tax=Giardia muris TaxID=5742 RepID=A0A4Z1SUB2_GIAMU|nr:hypothetical protein GMRT_10274 [Giardia muris]|eukprot:TNJ29434.1 hypothetical protein GMRT_10274 [Giardia muris]